MWIALMLATDLLQTAAPRLVPQRRLEHDTPASVRFSPDGRYVYIHDSATVIAYDLRTGLQRDSFLAHSDHFDFVDLSSDGGSLLVTDGGDVRATRHVVSAGIALSLSEPGPGARS